MDETANTHRNGPMKQQTLVPGMDRMLEIQRPVVQAAVEANGRLCDGLTAINREWTSFINRRLKDGLTASEELAACTSLPDMMQIYTAFFQQACRHYQSEFEQMAKLNASVAQETITTLQRTDNSYPPRRATKNATTV